MSKVSTSDGSAAVSEVEFTLRNATYPFVQASRSEACTVELAEIVPRNDGRYAEFFNVVDAEPDRIVSLAAAHESVDVSLLAEFDHGCLFEFLVSRNCPAVTLAQLGALPREVVGANGEGRIVAEIPPQYDPPTIIGSFLEEYPDAELATKREIDAVTPLFSGSSFQQLAHSHLTDRQREVLQAAFEAGYFDWPRECTGTDVADQLGISSATFSEHIRAAERKLLTVLFDDQWSGRTPDS